MTRLPLLLTIFLDSLGFGLILPLLSPLIMDANSAFLARDTSLSTRGLLFGLLASSFCIGQFFANPILGAVSDRVGRKKVLMLTLWLSSLSYGIAILSLFTHNVALMFVSRVLCGAAAGNFSVAQSMVADSSNNASKTKNFASLGMAWGVGFFIGPFLGGKLSDPTLWSGFSLVTPFYVAALLSLANVVFIRKNQEETLHVPTPRKIEFFSAIFQLKTAFSLPTLRLLFLTMFVFCFGWGFFTEFAPIYLMHHWEFSLKEIANFYAYVGFCIALSQGILIRPLVKVFSPETLLRSAFLLLGGCFLFALFVSDSLHLYGLLALVAFGEALVFPSVATLVSNLSPKEHQGEILGVYNSLQWAGIGLAPLFSGAFVARFPHMPLSVASVCMVLALLVLYRFFSSQKEKVV